MKITGIQKSSFIDYPYGIAAVVFLQGCNFRCSFCHNGALLDICKNDNLIDENVIFEFLKSRVNKLDAVVISGGEPTLHNDLAEFISKIKSLGFKIKLDTNGTNPTILKSLIEEKLIDYVAMDIKAPFEKYPKITNSKVDINKIKQRIQILLSDVIDYEFRTTVVKDELSYADFEKISNIIKGAKLYYLQRFIAQNALYDDFKFKNTYNESEFDEIIKILSPCIKQVRLR